MGDTRRSPGLPARLLVIPPSEFEGITVQEELAGPKEIQTDQSTESWTKTPDIDRKCASMKGVKRDLIDRLPQGHIAAPDAKGRHNFVCSLGREIQFVLDGVDIDPRLSGAGVDHHFLDHRAATAVPNDHRRHQQTLNQGELHGSSPRIRGFVTISITICSREVW